MKITIDKEQRTKLTGSTGARLFCDDPALEGGLYAQMLENPDFDAQTSSQPEEGGEAPIAGWTCYPKGERTTLKLGSDRPLSADVPVYLRLSGAGGAGVKNNAFGGIFLKKGEKYFISLYARSFDFKGKLAVGIARGGVSVKEKRFSLKPDGKWHAFSFRFRNKQTAGNCDFYALPLAAGTIHFAKFSMLPETAVKGLFRRDLMEQLKRFKPDFLELSVQSGTQARRLFAPLLLCARLDADPVPVLQAEHASKEELFQTADDLLCFANAKKETKWGRVREKMGEGEPFNVKKLVIKTEDSETFEELKAALQKNHPSVTVIPKSAGEEPNGDRFWKSVLSSAAEAIEREKEGIIAYPCLPLLAQEDAGRRKLIGFDAKSVYATADLHILTLMSHGTGSEALFTATDDENVHASATVRGGLKFLKIANLKETPVKAEIEGDGWSMTRVMCLEGEKDAFNSLGGRMTLVPYETAPRDKREIDLPPYSFSVLVFRK